MSSSLTADFVAAAMKQIQELGWKNFHPFQLVINRSVMPPLPFDSRENFLIQYMDTCTQEAIHQTRFLDLSSSPHERIFEVFMTRFEILDPYKSTLHHIWQDTVESPASLFSYAIPWFKGFEQLLNHAHQGQGEACDRLKEKAFVYYYLKIQKTWFEDHSPDLASTMAALDQGITNYQEIFC